MHHLQIGVIGLGGMGYKHAGRAEALGHEVAAGADVSEDARNEFGGAFDVPTYGDHDHMFEHEDLDAAIVAVPNRYHEPAVVAALERNVPVLVEKPLAHTVESAERIADAAHSSDAFCMMGFHSRFSFAADVFTAHRDAGRFGDLEHVETRWVRRRGIPGVGSWFTQNDVAGGGALIDIGVHALDFALYLLDYPPVEEVMGVTRSNFGSRPGYTNPDQYHAESGDKTATFDVEDSASAFVRCEGATISLETAWASNRTVSREVVAEGTDAGARMEIAGDELEIFEASSAGTDHFADADLTGTYEPSGHDAEVEYFLDRVAADELPAMNTVAEGLTVQRVIDAIYRSSEEGTAQRVE